MFKLKLPENTKHKKIIIILAVSLISLLVIFGSFEIVKETNYQHDASNVSTTAATALKTNNAELVKIETVEPEISLIFGGDVMLSRQVNTKMEKYHDYVWPFAKIASTTSAADLAIINLESPFLKDTAFYQVLSGSFSFKVNPLAVQGLTAAGIDLVSLANNHILNQGSRGISDTREILTKNNIKFVGAGQNDTEARQPEIFIIKNTRFAFLSYAYPEDNSVATKDSPGIANMDIEKMTSDIKNLKNNKQTDVIIVLMHAGAEYTTSPNWQQKDFARAAIDAGADIVVGHHPHWPQNFEFYKDKPIIYSLGNLVFDQMWSKETSEGLLLKMTWQNDLKELELIPIKISDYGQAEILPAGAERDNILKKIKAASDGLILKKDDEKI
jgi:poly-gamma-glutamate synthesis protein (capsule biosynthesis protein)